MLDAINDSNSSFYYLVSYIVDNAILYEVITSFWLSLPSSLLIISNLWETIKFTCFFLQQHLVYSSLDLFKPSLPLDGLSKIQITQEKVKESVYALEVTDSRTSGLGDTFLKCQAISSAGLSGARLKKFYSRITMWTMYKRNINSLNFYTSPELASYQGIVTD